MSFNNPVYRRISSRVHLDPWLIAILFFAATMRLVGMAWGLPDPRYASSATALGQTSPQVIVHPDAFQFAARPYLMTAIRDFDPHFFENPSFYIDLNVLLDLVSGDTAQYPPVNFKVDLRQVAPFTVYPMARTLSALMSMLGIAFIYSATRQLLNVPIARLAALLLAVAFADVQHAHYETTNVTAAAMLYGALWAATRLLQPQPGWRDYLLAGALVGLAGSTKYNVGLIGIIYVLCAAYAVWHRRERSFQPLLGFGWDLLRSPFILGLGAVALGFWLGTPYALFDSGKFLHDFQYITSQYIGGQGYPETSNAFPLYIVYGVWFGLGIVAAFCMVPGLWAVIRANLASQQRTVARFAGVSLLIFLTVYAFVVLRGRRLGDHLVIPVLGPCAIFAAAGAYWLWSELSRRWPTLIVTSYRLKSIAALILTLLFIATPLAYSIYFDRLLTLPDTRQLAQAWIYAHVPRGAHIHLTGPYNVPLDAADYMTSQTFGGDQRPLNSVPEAQGASVLVVSDAITFLYSSANRYIPAPNAARQLAFEQALTSGLPMIAQFKRPRWPGDDFVITTASYYHDPTITIYCLKPNCAS